MVEIKGIEKMTIVEMRMIVLDRKDIFGTDLVKMLNRAWALGFDTCVKDRDDLAERYKLNG